MAEETTPEKPAKPPLSLHQEAARVVRRKITGALSQAEHLVAPLTDGECQQLLDASAQPIHEFSDLLDSLRNPKQPPPRP